MTVIPVMTIAAADVPYGVSDRGVAVFYMLRNRTVKCFLGPTRAHALSLLWDHVKEEPFGTELPADRTANIVVEENQLPAWWKDSWIVFRLRSCPPPHQPSGIRFSPGDGPSTFGMTFSPYPPGLEPVFEPTRGMPAPETVQGKEDDHDTKQATEEFSLAKQEVDDLIAELAGRKLSYPHRRKLYEIARSTSNYEGDFRILEKPSAEASTPAAQCQ